MPVSRRSKTADASRRTPAPQASRSSSSKRKTLLIDLALQGGGSHGAFTWGVLDRLLEEEWLEIDGISGTSAGAMNAAVLADGFALGGREGARAASRNGSGVLCRMLHASAPSRRRPG